ncbi:MAG: molecular chaperone DnaJ [Firmicutes bacterium]|nr:molecular chaperone DnaJ [Bacillota bacterium]
MAEKRDYYEILGLKKGGPEAEIKKAYRRLAKEYHPDLHPDDKALEAKFKELNEAYEILSDADKRAQYDQFGHAAFDPNAGFGGGAGGAGFSGFGGAGFGDIFGDLFGGLGDIFGAVGAAHTGPQRGESIHVGVSVSFEEAAFGCTREVNVGKVELCEDCGGSGALKGTSAEPCTNCGGTGSVRTQQRVMGMTMQSSGPCPKCGGTGKIIKQPCASCKGSGTQRRQRKISVNIPAGIDDDQTISLRGQGNAGKSGGPAGDLLVTVSVRPHSFLQRDGTSVLCSIPISFTQAALGGEVEVPTLDGKVKYPVPEGTQTGAVFRLKGKGIPFLHGSGRGDQFVTVNVAVPKNLSAQQKGLLRQFAETMGETEIGKKKKR